MLSCSAQSFPDAYWTQIGGSELTLILTVNLKTHFFHYFQQYSSRCNIQKGRLNLLWLYCLQEESTQTYLDPVQIGCIFLHLHFELHSHIWVLNFQLLNNLMVSLLWTDTTWGYECYSKTASSKAKQCFYSETILLYVALCKANILSILESLRLLWHIY